MAGARPGRAGEWAAAGAGLGGTCRRSGGQGGGLQAGLCRKSPTCTPSTPAPPLNSSAAQACTPTWRASCPGSRPASTACSAATARPGVRGARAPRARGVPQLSPAPDALRLVPFPSPPGLPPCQPRLPSPLCCTTRAVFDDALVDGFDGSRLVLLGRPGDIVSLLGQGGVFELRGRLVTAPRRPSPILGRDDRAERTPLRVTPLPGSTGIGPAGPAALGSVTLLWQDEVWVFLQNGRLMANVNGAAVPPGFTVPLQVGWGDAGAGAESGGLEKTRGARLGRCAAGILTCMKCAGHLSRRAASCGTAPRAPGGGASTSTNRGWRSGWCSGAATTSWCPGAPAPLVGLWRGHGLGSDSGGWAVVKSAWLHGSAACWLTPPTFTLFCFFAPQAGPVRAAGGGCAPRPPHRRAGRHLPRRRRRRRRGGLRHAAHGGAQGRGLRGGRWPCACCEPPPLDRAVFFLFAHSVKCTTTLTQAHCSTGLTFSLVL